MQPSPESRLFLSQLYRGEPEAEPEDVELTEEDLRLEAASGGADGGAHGRVEQPPNMNAWLRGEEL